MMGWTNLAEIFRSDWATAGAGVVAILFVIGWVSALLAAVGGPGMARALGYQSWGQAMFAAAVGPLGAPIVIVLVYLALVYVGLGPAKP